MLMCHYDEIGRNWYVVIEVGRYMMQKVIRLVESFDLIKECPFFFFYE